MPDIFEESRTGQLKTLTIIYIAITFFSMVFSALIPSSYYIFRKLRHHPSQLIAIISVLEFFQAFHSLIELCPSQTFIEILHLDYFTLFMMFQTKEAFEADERRTMQDALCTINFSITYICFVLELCYNIALSVDLSITLYYPFISGKRRMKYYHMFSLLVTFVVISISADKFLDYCASENRDIFQMPDALKTVLATVAISFVVISVIVLLFASRHLHKDLGKMQEVKRQYIIRHMIYVACIGFVWAVAGYKQVALAFQKQFYYDHQKTIDLICNSVNLSGGFLLAIIRLSEPYYLGNVVLMLRAIYSKKASKELFITREQAENERFVDDSQDLWNSSLLNIISSSRNFNVIKLILTAVTSLLSEKAEISHSSEFSDDRISNKSISAIITHRRIYERDDFVDLTQMFESMKKNSRANTNPAMQDVVIQRADSDESPRFGGEPSRGHTKVPKDMETFAESLDPGRIYSFFNGFPTNLKKRAPFTMIEFAPRVFESLREFDGIKDSDIQTALDLFLNEKSIEKTKESTGNSGSLFFFSHDNRFVLKTLTLNEMDTLLYHVLPKYYFYVTEINKRSLLSRFYAAFRLEITGTSPIHLILMENTLSEVADGLLRYYDLKGSIIGRKAEPRSPKKERNRWRPPTFNKDTSLNGTYAENSSIILGKDQDFLQSDVVIDLHNAERDVITELLQQDIAFLEQLNLMDYSLLLGVAVKYSLDESPLDPQNKLLHATDFKRWRKVYSHTQQEYFSLGIIDYLQIFNNAKYIESILKSIRYKGNIYSCVEPSVYARRFLNFVSEIFRKNSD